MRVSENVLKWAMRLYPPLLFQRIWVQKFEKDFYGVKVKISKSILNNNYNRSIFGGTIFSGADPFYPILFHQILIRKGYKTKIWVKHSEIDFIKPAYTSLFFRIQLTESDIAEVLNDLNTLKRFSKPFIIELFDNKDQLCCTVKSEINIRPLRAE